MKRYNWPDTFAHMNTTFLNAFNQGSFGFFDDRRIKILYDKKVQLSPHGVPYLAPGLATTPNVIGQGHFQTSIYKKIPINDILVDASQESNGIYWAHARNIGIMFVSEFDMNPDEQMHYNYAWRIKYVDL